MKYQIELSEKQLKIVMRALERYFRLNMGQFSDYVDEIAFEGFGYNINNPDNRKLFDERINRRNVAQEMFDKAFRAACPCLRGKSEDTNRAIDIFTTFRYHLWEWRPEPKPHDTVDSRKPLPFINEELPIIRRV